LEVKIVRPTKQNPNKNANSLGETQIYGIIEDGFPIIGDIHICMAEPLLKEEGLNMQFCKVPSNSDKEEHKQPLTSEDFEVKKIDTFSLATADNQMKRLISVGFPKYIGIESVGLNVINGGYIMMQSFNYNGFKSAYFNPQIKRVTVNKIREHHTKYLKTNYKKVVFTY